MPRKANIMKVRADIVPTANIESLIRTIRGLKVILDEDLARIYDVPTYRFNEAVKRNIERFPEDFRFRLTEAEWETVERLRSQIAILKPRITNDELPLPRSERGRGSPLGTVSGCAQPAGTATRAAETADRHSRSHHRIEEPIRESPHSFTP